MLQSSAPSSRSAGGATDTEEDEEDAIKPLPDRLVIELTAHRTLALRDAVAENPAMAFQALLHNFVLTPFTGRIVRGCLESAFARRPFRLRRLA